MKLNIGSNSEIIGGWINIDINQHEGIIVHDATTPFIYYDSSIDFIFSEHFIEHLNRDEAILFFKECYRMLKPGGVVRTATFNIDEIINLCSGSWDFMKHHYLHGNYKHLSKMGFFNFCVYESGGHKCMYNPEYMTEILSLSGFSQFNYPKIKESEYSELQNLEWRPNSLCIVEAIK